MSSLSGYELRAGFKKAATWGTPVLVGAGDGFGLRSESMPSSAELIRSRAVMGLSEQPPVAGRDVLEGLVSTDLAYQAVDVLLAMTLGTAGAPVQQATSLAYKHTWTPKASLLGVFGTLVFAKKIDAWEYDSVKLSGFRLQCGHGRRASIEFRLLARKLNRNTSTGTNTNTTAASITLPSVAEFARFSQLAVRMNAQGGGALGASDSVYVSSFSLSVQNGLEPRHSQSGGASSEEPDRPRFLAVELELELTRYSAAALVDLGALKTAQKASVAFTGPVIDSGIPYSLTFWLPHLIADDSAANVGGPGRVPTRAKLLGFAAASAPTGFPTGFVEAVGVEAVNQRATDALA